MDIYFLMDRHGNRCGGYRPEEYPQAEAYARRHEMAIVARRYEYIDGHMEYVETVMGADDRPRVDDPPSDRQENFQNSER